MSSSFHSPLLQKMQNNESYDPNKDPLALAFQAACKEYSRLHPDPEVNIEWWKTHREIRFIDPKLPPPEGNDNDKFSKQD